MIAALKSDLSQSPVPLVFDHFAGAQAALGVEQPGFADVVELVRSGKTYVKISGAYRASKAAPDYGDVIPFAKALIAANPDRIVWGTDWPHPDAVTPPGKKPTDVTPLLQIDDGRLFNLLAVWTPDAAIREEDPGGESQRDYTGSTASDGVGAATRDRRERSLWLCAGALWDFI